MDISEKSALEQTEVQQDEEQSSAFKAYLRIFAYSDKLDWWLNIAGGTAAIASGVSLALVNVVFGGFVTTINDFARDPASNAARLRSDAGKYALYFVYLAIARFCLTYIYTVSFTLSSARQARAIRYQYLEATLSQNVGYFDAGNHGSVSSAVTTNGNMIQNGTAEKLGVSLQAMGAFFASFVVAFVAQWKLTLITIGIVPAIIIVVTIASAYEAAYETKIIRTFNRANAFAEDVISSMRTVHAFWGRSKLARKYDAYLKEARAIGNKKSVVLMALFSFEFFAVFAGYALAFWQGFRMYNSGEITSPGTIITVVFSVIIAATSLTAVAPNIISFTNAASAAVSMFKMIDRPSEINAFSTEGLTPERVNGHIEVKNVSFSYPTRANVRVLDDVSLDIPAGKVTAFVGASGSGKSTIVALLERWYNPTAGSIKLDGIEISDLNLTWLRTNIRLVQQEPVLFMGTILENVRYGLIGTAWENAPLDEQQRLVEEACKLSNAHDFISQLPEGYNTLCSERAGNLSGGQKQRIAIARSIISQPKVLLLDEATSALDPNSEGLVQQALDKASKNRTTLVIAHKLATIKNADNIIVLSRGRIIEQGTHQSLLEADGAYARLIKVQDLGKTLKKEEDQIETDQDEQDESSQPSDIELTKTLTKLPTNKLRKMEADISKDDYKTHKHAGMLSVVWTMIIEQKDLTALYILALICCCAGGATYPGQAILFSKIMNVFILDPEQRADRGNFFSLMFFIVAIGNGIVYAVMGWGTNIIVQTVTYRYRLELFNSILRQDMRFFDRAENTAGAMTSRLSSQPQSLVELMGFNLGIIVITLVNLTASTILAIAYGWKLGLVVVLGGLPPLVASGYIRMRLDSKMQNDNSARYTASAGLAGEAVGAIRTVSSLALERSILQRYQAKLGEVISQTIPQVLHIMVWFSLTQCIEFLFLALGFWYGCRLMSTGEYTMTQFYVVFLAVFFSGQAASQFFSWTTSLTKGKSGANYIFWMRSLQPIVQETPENRDNAPPPAPHELALSELRFSYPLRPAAQVLRGVSLDIKPGQFVALVGASGCGKSTLIALLERFYDPATGSITLNNHDITDLNPRLYRQIVSLVQQEPTLYQGSIRENIALGIDNDSDDSVDEAAIIEACKQANAWEFISSLPDGLSTQCGSKGLSLSGGQRQRIAIARALVRNPKILLLDEATSALDTESEKIVQSALQQAAASGNRITVAVAHRLSTIKDADMICVFLGGKIVEQGTHAELLEKGEIYAKMCQAQSLDRQA